jgi:hypothetical protein
LSPITLYLKDGTQLVTVEPHIDAVFDVAEECGEPYADMVLATERRRPPKGDG